MINQSVITDTVSRLLEAGIDDPTIVSTLVDAGISNEEALELIRQLKAGKAGPSAQSASVAPQHDLNLMKAQLDTQAEAHDLHQTVTANLLDDHEEKIADIAGQVQEVRAAVAAQPAVDPKISYRLSELEKKLSDVDAATKACLDVLQKVLENNRKILTELEAKK